MLEQVETFLVPYFTSNVISLALLFVCFKWHTVGRILFGLIFLAASIFNSYLALTAPQAYLMYGDLTPVQLYKEFIFGLFSDYTMWFVLAIAVGQLLIAIGLLFNGKLLLPAVIGAIVFLLAIVPLGVGSAFPAGLILAFGVWVLYRKRELQVSLPV